MMLLFNYMVALAAAVTFVQAHFSFIRLALNDEWQAPTRFIRNKSLVFDELWTPNTNVNTRLYLDPVFVTDYPESVRCGRDSMAHAADTEVLSVQAGDTLEVAHLASDPPKWTSSQFNNCTDGRGTCNPPWLNKIIHDGPLLIHLSKVPDGSDVRKYDGSGEWVKIYALGIQMMPTRGTLFYWKARNREQVPPRFIFKLPAGTPAGQYLMRIDLLWPGVKGDKSGAQMYPSCAQIQVESDKKGALPKGISIPKDFSDESPGMATTLKMYQNIVLDEDFVYPGGLLWDGENMVEDKPIS